MKGLFASAAGGALLLSTIASTQPAAAAPLKTAAEERPAPAPPSPPAPQPGPSRRWYGWELLVGYLYSDAYLAIGTALAVKGDVDMAAPFLVLGYGGHLLTGGIVHRFHDSEAKSKGSLGVNAGPMVVGFVTGLIAAGCSEVKGPRGCEDRGRAGMALGSAAGAVLGGIIDVAAMSYETGYGSGRQGRSRWSVAPMDVGTNGGGLSVIGQL